MEFDELLKKSMERSTLSDEILKKALEQYTQAEPSRDFLDKMDALYRQRTRMRRERLMKQCIRAAVVVLCLLCLALAAPSVYATVSGWISSGAGDRAAYQSKGEYAPIGSGSYAPTWIPEDCQLVQEIHRINGKVYRYVDTNGNHLFFKYYHNLDHVTSESRIDTGDSQRQLVSVGEQLGDLYITQGEEPSTALLWLSPDEGTLFSLLGIYDADTMIRIAESVKAVE